MRNPERENELLLQQREKEEGIRNTRNTNRSVNIELVADIAGATLSAIGIIADFVGPDNYHGTGVYNPSMTFFAVLALIYSIKSAYHLGDAIDYNESIIEKYENELSQINKELGTYQNESPE